MMFLYLTCLIVIPSIVLSFENEQLDEEIRNIFLNKGIGFKRYPDYNFQRNLSASSIYNPFTQKCCKGTVHQGNNLVSECCGSNIYDKSTQLCCNGQVHDRKYAYLCCGEKSYNTKTSTCCNNVVASLPDNTNPNNIACCEDKAYDTTTQLCCSNPTNYLMQPIDKLHKQDTACCAEQTYNPETSTCCTDYSNGKTISTLHHHQGNKTQCCGQQLFDPEQLGGTLGCCGNKTYNYEAELCCYAHTDNVILQKKSKNDNCCQDKVYNTLTQMCCNDKVLDNVDSKKMCCGEAAINYDKQVCCYHDGLMQAITKRSANDTGCCATIPYDYNKELCCYENGESILVKKSNPDEYMCCGSKSYNPSKDLCCINGELSNPNVYRGSVYNQICCGEKSIDINTHYCCGGVAVAFSEGNVACCGNELLYDPALETCCWGDKVKPKLFPYSEWMSCCGDRLYNRSSNEMCCDGKLYRSKVDESCCGDRVYNYRKEVCCGDNVLAKNGEESQCCYTYMSDEDKDCLVKLQPHIERALSGVFGPQGTELRPRGTVVY